MHIQVLFFYIWHIAQSIAYYYSTAEKPYICEVCERCFSRPGERNRHKKIVHSDFTPYSCSVCGKCFKTPKDIKRHEKIHKPPEYFCALCGKGFAQKNNMKTHMQSYCSKRKSDMAVTGKSMCWLTWPYQNRDCSRGRIKGFISHDHRSHMTTKHSWWGLRTDSLSTLGWLVCTLLPTSLSYLTIVNVAKKICCPYSSVSQIRPM